MRQYSGSSQLPLIPTPTDPEPVDLHDPAAVTRAISLHQAGKAVFAVPFGSAGDGTLTWLDPRDAEAQGIAVAARGRGES